MTSARGYLLYARICAAGAGTTAATNRARSLGRLSLR